MAQVIDKLEDAGGAECIRLRVRRSRNHPNLILADWQHVVDEHEYGMGSIGQSELRSPVDIEYKRAFNEAVQHGVPFLWVDDPDGLFPRAWRPTPP